MEEEAFPVPVHRYGFWATPFTGNNGLYVGQQIPYDQILPRCKGKLSPLEWKGLSEEDRYTARNHYIRCRKLQQTCTRGRNRGAIKNPKIIKPQNKKTPKLETPKIRKPQNFFEPQSFFNLKIFSNPKKFFTKNF